MSVDLKYLNAINILANAKLDSLQSIHDAFGGDFERAWHSNLSKYMPREKNAAGRLTAVDYGRIQKSVDVEREWAKLEKEKIDIVTILDKDYPKPLRHIPHPPFLLYVRGSRDVWKNECFAVVGTRALTEYGKRSAIQITFDLARAGLVITSGLMYGIDELAHKSTLEVGGKTIAVLGSGVDNASIAPRRNEILARKIIEGGGAVISEYAVGTHGSLYTFPQRDRIISGLSRGVLVVEADIKSGAMITANCAIDQNRDVFAVPGSIFARTSEGTNFIIKKGAKLVACAEDILEEYDMQGNVQVAKVKIEGDNPVEEKILSVLSSEPMTADDIIRKTGLETSQASAALMIMELNKKIKNLGNGKFVCHA